MNNRTLLVTGIGGFLGSRVVEAAYRTDFAKVRGGIRRWANASRVARFPVDFAPCDIENSKEVDEACKGATTVVHCAYSDTRESIVDGTANMLHGALQAGVKRFVYISSAEVYGRDVAGAIDESYECKPTGNSYGDAKLEAEQLVQEFHQRGLPTTILRPSIIYGPFSQSWTIDLATRLQSGNWGQFEGFGEGICNLVHVDDLVRAIFLSIEKDEAIGQVFNVVGPDRPTWNEYFERFNTALKLPPLKTIKSGSSSRTSMVRDSINVVTSFVKQRFEDPLMRIYLKGGPVSDLMKMVRDKLKTTPTASELQGLYSRQANFSTDKVQRLLGYEPSIQLDAGLAMCQRWLAFHGYINGADEILAPRAAG